MKGNTMWIRDNVFEYKIASNPTRKHFKEIAEILHINKADPLIIRDMANFCSSSNPRFNRSKFYEVAFKEEG